ncbi:MAG: TorF family putative porin [Mariprofundaceae bacterium]|nr:TorF family putative porin [Mariprofundaceae bacterium]
MKKLGLTLAMIMSAGFATAIPAQAEDSAISGDIGVYSQYMWRGMQQTQTASVQGDYGLDIGGGLSANVWFAAPLGNATATTGNKTEFDFTVDYSGEAGGVSYSVGAIAYTYLNAAAGNANEVYAGVGFGPVSATYYYAVSGSWKKDAYLDVALTQALGGFDLGADFGIYLPSTSTANPTGFPTTKNGLGHIDLSISKDVTVGDASMTPSLMISVPQYSGKPNNANQVVAGVNFAY